MALDFPSGAIPYANGFLRRRFFGTVFIAGGATFTLGVLTRFPRGLPQVWAFPAVATGPTTNDWGEDPVPAPAQTLTVGFRKNVGTPAPDDYTVKVDNQFENPALTKIGASVDIALVEFQP